MRTKTREEELQLLPPERKSPFSPPLRDKAIRKSQHKTSGNLVCFSAFRIHSLRISTRDLGLHLSVPMKLPRYICAITTIAALNLCGVLYPAARAAQSKEVILIDFADTRKDPDGTSFRPYEYVFGEWTNRVSDLRGRGVLVKAPNGKGGLGENKTMVDFSKKTTVELYFVIGNANHAANLSFSLEDKDGTEQTWTLPLAEFPAGRLGHATLDLNKCSSEQKPGKTPGMNFKKINTWQVKGDFTEPNIEILLIKLSCSP